MEQYCFLGQGLLALSSAEGGMGQESTGLSVIYVSPGCPTHWLCDLGAGASPLWASPLLSEA